MTLTTAKVQFIIPKEATNLIINPSFGFATTGYTTFGAGTSIARVTTQSRRGIASCEITTATNVASGIYYTIALTNAVQYSFSADILDVVGQTFNLFIASATDGTLASGNTTWTGTGYWKRRSVTWTCTSGATYYLFVTRASVASTTKFYVDGWQLETGAESTYLDGDMVGYVTGETAYRWNGTNHASTSWRSGQTRSGGTYVSLSTYAKLLTIVGLGMAPISNIGLASTMGGSYYQNSVITERPFSLIVNVNGSGDYAIIQRAKAGIETCLKIDKTVYRQPLLIQYDELDANGLEIAETLEIPCLYEPEPATTTPANERISLNFRMFMPLIQQQGEHGAALGYQTTVADTDYIIKRGSDGTWASIGKLTGDVYCMCASPDGSIYAGGNFTNLTDVNGDYISKWNGTAWSSLGTGMQSIVYALACAPDGSIYAGGSFTSAGGVADTVSIAKWNGSVWAPLSTGITGSVRALVFGIDGSLYVGGNFTDVGDANGDYIVKWTGSAWVSLGTGMNGIVYSLAVGPDGTLYAGGNFHLAGGVANTEHIAKWDGTAWVPLSTGMNNIVYAISVGSDNTIYAGGNFSTSGGITTNIIAKWDGTTWSSMAGGGAGSVRSLGWAKNIFYAGGIFSIMGGVAASNVAIWNGTSWAPADATMPGTPTIYTILVDRTNNVYLGFDTAGSTVSATVTVPTIGTATSYPTITLGGAGVLAQIKNYTTGKAIYFNLTMLVGETAYLVLDPNGVRFWSVFRGNLMSTILPGSDLDFFLVPGSNNISAYYSSGTTAGSYISMTWKDQYHSIDGAVR
jgi:hypothetical protein